MVVVLLALWQVLLLLLRREIIEETSEGISTAEEVGEGGGVHWCECGVRCVSMVCSEKSAVNIVAIRVPNTVPIKVAESISALPWEHSNEQSRAQ